MSLHVQGQVVTAGETSRAVPTFERFGSRVFSVVGETEDELVGTN